MGTYILALDQGTTSSRAIVFDRQGRILRMVYLNQDLTEAGKYLFPRLLQKFLVFTDRKGKTSLETMLNRWYTALEKEYLSQTAG